MSVRAEAARVDEALREAVTMVQAQAEARGVRVSASDCGNETRYDGDPKRVQQILVNLLNNAVKFTPAGGSVRIDCAAVAQNDGSARVSGAGPWLVLRVSDTGVGIPRE